MAFQDYLYKRSETQNRTVLFLARRKKREQFYIQWSFASVLACFTVGDRGNQIGN